jgi:hypothetical protein
LARQVFKFLSEGAIAQKTKQTTVWANETREKTIGKNTRFGGVDLTSRCQRKGNSYTKGNKG